MIRLLLLIFVFFTSSVAVSADNISTNSIVVLGDSLSAGFGLQHDQGWVPLLKKRLAEKDYQYNVVNASISGETTGGGLRRVEQILATHNPVIVILELGANDGLRGLNLASMKNNLSDIVKHSLKNQAKVLLLGIRLPPNYGPSYTQKFSRVFLDISEENQISLLPSLFQGFESDLSYFQADQIHPNAKAQNHILDNVWPMLVKLLR